MFNRKFSSNIRLKRRMIRSTIILLVVCLGIGYSAFSTNLGINGTLNVSKYDQTLYGVLEKAVSKGYAREYTGDHQDSMAEVGSKKIYHWYAPDNTAGNTLATEILDKNNVIFANHCWQMIRTTDTGGVKMVYNGEVENGQCLNTRGNHVGYSRRTTQSMSTTYYYGTSYTYDKTNDVFSLDGTVTTGTIQLGQYTCKSTTSTGTCSTLYLVDTLSSGTTYYVLLLNGNSNYSQFGTLTFNQESKSPAYVGYMYNEVYSVKYKQDPFSIGSSSTNLYTNYYYSDTIDYGNLNQNEYTLINPQLISSLSDINDLIGKYVLSTGTQTSDLSAYYILGVSGNRMQFRQLKNGDTNTSLTVGDSYTENDGIYYLTNPTNITYIDWYSNTSDYSIYKGKYVCDGNNISCTNLRHIYPGGNPTKSNFYYSDTNNTYSYSESVSYSGGTYTLTGDIKTFWDFYDSTNRSYLSTHHYTCLENGTSCSEVGYVVKVEYFLYYTQLSEVSDVSAALINMLSVDNVNTINSTIKTGVDVWYKKYMNNYTSKLEDTIFCNDRSITDLGGWNPNGGSVTSNLRFKNYSLNSDLSCTNVTDKFSMANTKAQLTYPVGLLTKSETNLLSNSTIRKTGQFWWLGSPGRFDSDYAAGNYIITAGGLTHHYINQTFGVRPAISLKPGTEYASGTGSMANPYVVE